MVGAAQETAEAAGTASSAVPAAAGGAGASLSSDPTTAMLKPLIVLDSLYVLVAGLFCHGFVRRPLMRWYRSQSFIVFGNGPVDILLRQIGYRLGFEGFILFVSCLFGASGGWFTVRRWNVAMRRKAAEAALAPPPRRSPRPAVR